MPTELIAPDEFLSRLSTCFASAPKEDETSSVWMTHKRYTRADAAEGEGEDVDMADSAGPSSGQYMVLVRCTFGTTKFSTRIPATQLPTFHARYGSLLKASMASAMRKRDKKKEKARAEALAKRTKEVYEDVGLGEGGKRGKGRRQRQRKIKAQEKREVERERIESRAAAAKAADI